MSEDAPRLLKAAALAVFLLAALHLAGLVCDYSRCFQDNEVYANWLGRIVLEGRGFSGADLKTAFDVWSLDGGARPRFVSYLCAIWTAKARLALWDFLPPHPSFSPVWIFSLLLAPWLLYRFLKGELECRWSALLGTGLYMVTAGYLSSASMLFHPGKPLANVVVIWTLYAAMRANRRAESLPTPETPRYSAPMAFFLVGILPVLLFTDETALFALAILPAWNVRFFIPRRMDGQSVWACLANAGAYSVAPLVYLGTVFVAIPRLTRPMLGQEFDFGWCLSLFQGAGKFDLAHGLQHLTTLLGGALAPWARFGMEVPTATSPHFHPSWLLVCLVAFAGAGRAVHLRRLHRGTFARIAVLMAVFAVFQTYVASHHPFHLVVSGYYYGAIFSVLLAILLACVFGSFLRDSSIGWLALGALGYLAFIQLHNFQAMNRSWLAHSHAKDMGWFGTFTYNPLLAYGDTSEIVRLYSNQTPGMYGNDIPAPLRRHRFAAAVETWKRRDGGYREYLGTKPLALSDLWLLTELYYGRTPGTVVPGGERRATAAQDVGLLYQGALARARIGQKDEEPLPVLAFRQMALEDYFALRGLMSTRLAYPWPFADVGEGVRRFREIGYTHWLVPPAGIPRGAGPFWAFHDGFVAARDAGTLDGHGVMDAGRIDVFGREVAAMDMRQ